MQKALGERLKKSPPTSAKVQRGTPLYEQIHDSLWTLIFKGEISPGERLSDRDWAKKLKTSRTPVREAMRQMARDGILFGLENGGYQVRAVDPEGLEQLYKCRAPLAALAVHETTRLGDKRVPKQIKSVVENTKRAIKRRNSAATLKFNSRFYELLVQGCGNPYLVIVMSNLQKLILFYRISLLQQVSGERGEHTAKYFEHLARGNERLRQITGTMEAGNAEHASNLMLQHLLASAKDMSRLLQPT